MTEIIVFILWFKTGSESGDEDPLLKRQDSLEKLKRYKKGFGFLRVLCDSHLHAGIGLLLMSVGVFFAGLYVSRHYDQLHQHSVVVGQSSSEGAPSVASVGKHSMLERNAVNQEPSTSEQHLVTNNNDASGYSRSLVTNNAESFLEVPPPTTDASVVQSPTKEGAQQAEKEKQVNDFFKDFVRTENIVGSDTTWWISVTTLSVGLLLLTPMMVNICGSWMECK